MYFGCCLGILREAERKGLRGVDSCVRDFSRLVYARSLIVFTD